MAIFYELDQINSNSWMFDIITLVYTIAKFLVSAKLIFDCYHLVFGLSGEGVVYTRLHVCCLPIE